ncbi:MAG: alpha/beta hydrolase [Cyclobacteriaceae bacterium]
MKTISRFVLYLTLSLLISCSSEDDPIPADDVTNPDDNPSNPNPTISPKLVSTTEIGSFSAAELTVLIGLANIDLGDNAFQYDVTVSKMVYETEFKGETINASGLIITPTALDEDFDLVVFNHGTITAHSEAFSETSPTGQLMPLYAALAATGNIAIFPDMIGFGESSNFFHPYYVKDVTASTVRDMIEVTASSSSSFTGDLYIAGYSQGGYITMVSHEDIQGNPIDGVNLRASFPSSGGYDVKGMQEYFFSLETYDNPYYLGYVSLAYQDNYDVPFELDELFNQPYADLMPSLFDGSNTSGLINAQLTDDISELIVADALVNFDTDNQYDFLRETLIDNGVITWTPTIPMFMYHGSADITVPYQNSVDTYERLLSNGASPDVLKFITLEDKTHGTGVVPYIESFMAELSVIKN